jgi:folate-binding protein YgfZ
LFAFDLFRDETGFWISTAPGTTPGLASALENYHFTEKLSIAETGQHAPMVVCGPHSDTLVRSVVVNLPGPRDHSWVRGSFRETEVVVTRSGFAGLPGLRLDVGPHGAADLWNALRLAGARPSGLVVRDSLRVEACEALYGVDVDANVYPQEARLESAFSLTKGCYVGQEVVAKIDTYGGLNKRLVVLRVAHDDPVPRGARLYREEEGERRDLGVVTSWAYSFALDAGIALAYVKRRHQEPGTVFQLDETGQVATIIASPVRRASDEVKDPKP